MLTRRVLLSAVAAEAAACAAPDGPTGPGSLDRSLDALHETDPEYENGLSNHGPMAAEALEALGHTERIEPFVDGYIDRLVPLEAGAPLGDAEQIGALGDVATRARWIATFIALLAESDPATLVKNHFTLLAPGYAAAALHAPIRMAHALRAIATRDSSSRRTELAHALGYWAARHQKLPGQPGANAVPGLAVVAALANVPMVPQALRMTGGLIIERLRVVAKVPEFATAIEAVDLDALPIGEAITELASAAARIYLIEPNAEFVYLHAITGSSALRLMLPYLSPEQQRAGLGYAFQSVAAIHATHGSKAGVPAPSASAPNVGLEELVAGAATSDDEHTIKLIEAALREHAIDPRPELHWAAKNRL